MDKEIERQIEERSSSAIEFRKSIDRIIFKRLTDFFKAKGKEISRDSKLKDLLEKRFPPSEWYKLEDIGLRIPELRRHKAFVYVVSSYVFIAILLWTLLFLKNLDKISIIWTLPLGIIASALFTLTFSPILGFMMIFKKTLLPVESVDNLVDGVISENWSNLLIDDKRLFKEILEQELINEKKAGA